MYHRVRLTRRRLLSLAAGVLALHPGLSARAQATAGCQIGFVNGLLQISGADCQLLAPPTLAGTQVAPPSSIAAPAAGVPSTTLGQTVPTTGAPTTLGATTATTPQQARQLRRRQHHQRKQDNAHTHKKTKRSRQQTHAQKKRAANVTCADFTTQKAAVEHLGQFPKDARELDPDGDGAACEELPPVTCQDFPSREDAAAWVALYGFSPSRDPYHLFRGEGAAVCPGLNADEA